MATTQREEHLLDWLRNAHAMEQQAETLLSTMAGRLEHYPALQQRIEQHVDETRSQAERLEDCIERLGGDTSTSKDLAAKAMATMHAMGNAMMSDEVVKGSGFSYAFEHFEIAQYRVLIAAATAAGDDETAAVCAEILEEEQAMADWLADHLEDTVEQFLERSEMEGVSAKR